MREPNDGSPPPEIIALAEARRDARASRDWVEADRLRAGIEAAGWKVVDQATSYRLSRAHPPTVIEGTRTIYGSSADVPDRLAESPVGSASIVAIADDWADDIARLVATLAAHAPDGTQVIVVAEDPSPEQAQRLAALDSVDSAGAAVAAEVVWMNARLGRATALNAGIRRARAATVILLDGNAEPVGDIVSPLVNALADPTVAVAGAPGRRSTDMRHYHEAPSGEVDAIGGAVLAFRRADYADRGPLDEKFRVPDYLDTWWSFVVRDEGSEVRARRAVAVDLPVDRREHRVAGTIEPAERDRLVRRNFYRVIDRFGTRRDLLVGTPHPPRGNGTEADPDVPGI